MIRLVDRILSEPLMIPPWLTTGPQGKQYERVWRKHILDELGQAEIIVADNVCDYMYCEVEQEQWLFDRDFPNVAPPFPRFWIECRRPTRPVLSSTHGTYDPRDRLCRSWGVLFRAATVENLAEIYARDEQERVDQLWRFREYVDFLREKYGQSVHEGAQRISLVPESGDAAQPFNLRAYVNALRGLRALEEGRYDEVYDPSVRWVVEAMSFGEFEIPGRGDVVTGPLTRWIFEVDGQGQIVARPFFGVLTVPGATQHPTEDALLGMSGTVYVSLLTLSLMHCKNVERQREEPPAKLSRAHQRRRGRPLVSYHVLKINPFREAARRGERTDDESVRHAFRLHIVRGHFADYRQGKGLFGKHRGMFWFDAFVRGLAQEGKALKGYQVEGAQKV